MSAAPIKKIPSDIEIAQNADIKPIVEIARQVGLRESDLELYGHHKAKISLENVKEKAGKKGCLILVTAISATPAGVGKSTISVGLAQALKRQGKSAMLCLREPRWAPAWESKEEQQEAGIRRLSRWRISTFISPATCMQLPQLTTC